MPHSGGGGSHSGGSSYSGGSSGGSGGSAKSYRHSSTPFKGGRAFVIYNRMNEPKVVYTDEPNYHEETTKGQYIRSVVFAIIAGIPGIVIMLLGLVTMFSAFSIGYKKTVVPEYVDQSIFIQDDYGHLTDAELDRLDQSLSAFRDHTGIIPAVEFTNDAAWELDYDDMESFAYNEYICNFDDEYHVLITYGYGAENPETGFNEFHYHTMWGDDLGKTAKKKDEDQLIDLLQKNLARANGDNVGDAMATTFDDYLAYYEAKGFTVDMENLGGGFAEFFFGLIVVGAFIGTAIAVRANYLEGQKKGIRTYKIDGKPKMLKCDYCGCTYYAGTIGTCPHCGAPLKMEADE